MTANKIQSKVKTSTVAIIVLSVLLAVALASTFILAAFNASRNATSTITFGNGLTITLSKGSTPDGGSDLNLGTITDASAEVSVLGSDKLTVNANKECVVGFVIKCGTSASGAATPTLVTSGLNTSGVTVTSNDMTIVFTVNTDAGWTLNAEKGVLYRTITAAEATGSTPVNVLDGIVITATDSDYNKLADHQVAIKLGFYATTFGDAQVADEAAAQTAVIAHTYA